MSYRTFEQAADDVDATVVLASDWGLTFYLTVPARLVRCSPRALWLLLSDLDATYWMLGDDQLASVGLVHAPAGSELIAADGTVAYVVDGVWTDTHFAGDIGDQAAEVVLGVRPRIDLALLRAARDREIERRRTVRSSGRMALAWDYDISPPLYPFMPFSWYELEQD